MLHALGACLAVTVAYHGAARGIAIRALEIDLTGELDINRFLGLSETIRLGYQIFTSGAVSQVMRQTLHLKIYGVTLSTYHRSLTSSALLLLSRSLLKSKIVRTSQGIRRTPQAR
ncbi:MAG: OsmC family protein [Halobacteriota archaeon]